MKPLKITIILLLLAHSTWSQEVKELTVGDKMPDVVFENVLNYPKKEIRLSDFKGKLRIFDFWSSSCTACIQLFPHMDSLQREFGDKLQILLVNGKSKLIGDDKAKILKIIERVKLRTGVDIQLPVVYDAPILDEYFYYKIIPHEIWVDENDVIVGITSAVEVNRENIKAFFEGEEVKMQVKRDIKFDRNLPLFVNGNAGHDDEFLYRSILTTAKEGDIAGYGQRRNDSNKIVGLYMFNVPLSTLITNAGYNYSLQNNKMIIDLNDNLKYNPPNNEERYKYLFCYDITLPPGSFEDLQKAMRKDIERYLHITIKQEKRMWDCMVLIVGKSLKKSYSKNERMESDLELTTANKYVKGFTVEQLVSSLNLYSPIPIIDETGVTQTIDMELPYDLTDKDALISALQKAGFEVTQEKREMDITVITDKKQTQ